MMIDKLLQDRWGIERMDLLNAIEIVTRVGLLSLAVTYGLGLVIVNAYLARFGIVSLGLLRVEYVMAGMLWLFWLALGYAAVKAAARAWANGRNQVGGKIGPWALTKTASAAAVPLLSPFVLSGLLMGQQYDPANPQILVASGVILYMAILVPLILRAARRVWWIPCEPKDRRDATSLYATIFVAIVFATALQAYSQYVYPLCLPMFGGGRPYPVHLTFVPSAIETLRQSGIDPGQNYDLISDTGEWLVVARADAVRASAAARAIRVRRDLVASIVSSPVGKSR